MPVRVRYKLESSISSTTAEEKDLGNGKFEILTDALGEGGVRKTLLVAAATDVALDIGNVAAINYILIRTNPKDPTDTPAAVELKKSGTGGEVISIEPLGTSKEGHFLLSTSGVTSLHASNPGSVDMEVTLFVCGD